MNNVAEVLKRFPGPVMTVDSRPYWEATSKGLLHVQVCTHCERGIFPPRPSICPYCHSPLRWESVSREGTVYSWIGVDAVIHDWQQGIIPYVVMLVELEQLPDVRIPSFYGGSREPIRIGARGSVTFVQIDRGYGVPVFDPS